MPKLRSTRMPYRAKLGTDQFLLTTIEEGNNDRYRELR